MGTGKSILPFGVMLKSESEERRNISVGIDSFDGAGIEFVAPPSMVEAAEEILVLRAVPAVVVVLLALAAPTGFNASFDGLPASLVRPALLLAPGTSDADDGALANVLALGIAAAAATTAACAGDAKRFKLGLSVMPDDAAAAAATKALLGATAAAFTSFNDL